MLLHPCSNVSREKIEQLIPALEFELKRITEVSHGKHDR